MALTREQKDGLIECLYDPICALIEGFVKKPKNFKILERMSNEPPDTKWGMAWDLKHEIRWDSLNKVKFETRVLAILDAYLDGRVLAEPLASPEPVADAAEIEASRQRTKEQALKWLAEFKWENLKSADYDVARTAWYSLDLLKGACSMHEDTQEALKKAAEKAGISI